MILLTSFRRQIPAHCHVYGDVEDGRSWSTGIEAQQAAVVETAGAGSWDRQVLATHVAVAFQHEAQCFVVIVDVVVLSSRFAHRRRRRRVAKSKRAESDSSIKCAKFHGRIIITPSSSATPSFTSQPRRCRHLKSISVEAGGETKSGGPKTNFCPKSRVSDGGGRCSHLAFSGEIEMRDNFPAQGPASISGISSPGRQPRHNETSTDFSRASYVQVARMANMLALGFSTARARLPCMCGAPVARHSED